MSRVIPKGALIVATLHRPIPDIPCPGVQTFTAHTDVNPETVNAFLISEIDALLEPFPALTRPGPPVTLLLHTLFGGKTIVAAAYFKIERALLRPDLRAAMIGQMDIFVNNFFSTMPSFNDTPLPGTPMGNAPTTRTPQ